MRGRLTALSVGILIAAIQLTIGRRIVARFHRSVAQILDPVESQQIIQDLRSELNTSREWAEKHEQTLTECRKQVPPPIPANVPTPKPTHNNSYLLQCPIPARGMSYDDSYESRLKASQDKWGRWICK